MYNVWKKFCVEMLNIFKKTPHGTTCHSWDREGSATDCRVNFYDVCHFRVVLLNFVSFTTFLVQIGRWCFYMNEASVVAPVMKQWTKWFFEENIEEQAMEIDAGQARKGMQWTKRNAKCFDTFADLILDEQYVRAQYLTEMGVDCMSFLF